MTADTTTAFVEPTTTPPIEVGIGWFPVEGFNLDWHRKEIHTRPVHGCILCVPTPCACGYTGDCCRDYFEHRRDQAGAETSWRELA